MFSPGEQGRIFVTQNSDAIDLPLSAWQATLDEWWRKYLPLLMRDPDEPNGSADEEDARVIDEVKVTQMRKYPNSDDGCADVVCSAVANNIDESRFSERGPTTREVIGKPGVGLRFYLRQSVRRYAQLLDKIPIPIAIALIE